MRNCLLLKVALRYRGIESTTRRVDLKYIASMIIEHKFPREEARSSRIVAIRKFPVGHDSVLLSSALLASPIRDRIADVVELR